MKQKSKTIFKVMESNRHDINSLMNRLSKFVEDLEKEYKYVEFVSQEEIALYNGYSGLSLVFKVIE